jgi:hypothetical protein
VNTLRMPKLWSLSPIPRALSMKQQVVAFR